MGRKLSAWYRKNWGGSSVIPETKLVALIKDYQIFEMMQINFKNMIKIATIFKNFLKYSELPFLHREHKKGLPPCRKQAYS